MHYNANLAELCGPSHKQSVRSSSYWVQIHWVQIYTDYSNQKKTDWAVLSDAPYKKHWHYIITYLPCTGNCNSIGIKMFLCLQPVHWTNLITIKAIKQHEELILSTIPCRISTCKCYVAYVYHKFTRPSLLIIIIIIIFLIVSLYCAVLSKGRC